MAFKYNNKDLIVTLKSEGLLVLDADTGKIKWYFQYTPNDPYDFDGVNELTIVNTKIFGKKSISIESILQKEDLINDANVPIVLVTHEVLEKNIIDALKDIENLDVVKGKIVKIRIEELDS